MSSPSKRILIVDDDADYVESLAFFLETNGYQVLKAHDGSQGLRVAQTESPDLILVDIMMGERTEGLFTVQQMRLTPGLATVPIFVISALYSQVPDFRIQPQGVWMAHDEFMPKPVDMPLLLEKIRHRLGEPAGAKETQG